MQYMNGRRWARGWGFGLALVLLLVWGVAGARAQRDPPDVTVIPANAVPLAGAVPPEEPTEPPPNNIDPHQHVGNIVPVPTPLPIGRVRNVPLVNDPVPMPIPIPINPVHTVTLLDDPVWSYGGRVPAVSFGSETPAFADACGQAAVPVAVPEPGTLMLGICTLASLRRRR